MQWYLMQLERPISIVRETFKLCFKYFAVFLLELTNRGDAHIIQKSRAFLVFFVISSLHDAKLFFVPISSECYPMPSEKHAPILQ